MSRRLIIVMCLLVSLAVLVGWVSAVNAGLTRSTMSRILGGCDECDQWTHCTHCDESQVVCTSSTLYVECLYSGEDPNLGCGVCDSWEAGCGYWQQCYDPNCNSCDPPGDTCSGCNHLQAYPEYETCPDWDE